VYSGGQLIGHTPFSTSIDDGPARRFIVKCQGYADLTVTLTSKAPATSRALTRIPGSAFGVDCE